MKPSAKKAGIGAAGVGGIAGLAMLLSQLGMIDSQIVSESELTKEVSVSCATPIARCERQIERFAAWRERHVELGNENLRDREAWRKVVDEECLR